jgi:hypothetical protein
VLPQGTDAARFGIADPQAYVTEVLDLALGPLKAARPTQKLPDALKTLRVVVAGHSGGGRAAVLHAGNLTATAATSDDEWARSEPLMLFDGINGTTELGNVWTLVERWLKEDRDRLLASKDPEALLKRRGLKLRSTHTSTPVYTSLNAGGSYEDKVRNPDGSVVYKELPDGKKVPEMQTIRITPERSLKGKLQKWFDTEGKALGTHATLLAEQYVVEKVSGGHEQTVGTGFTPEGDKSARGAAPTGVTGASKKAGVPDYVKGKGHLEQGLSKLGPG